MMTSSFLYKQHKINVFNERLSERVAELQILKCYNDVYLVEQTEGIHVKRQALKKSFSIKNILNVITWMVTHERVMRSSSCEMLLQNSVNDFFQQFQQHESRKLREKCPNTELFLVRIFLYSD